MGTETYSRGKAHIQKLCVELVSEPTQLGPGLHSPGGVWAVRSYKPVLNVFFSHALLE